MQRKAINYFSICLVSMLNTKQDLESVISERFHVRIFIFTNEPFFYSGFTRLQIIRRAEERAYTQQTLRIWSNGHIVELHVSKVVLIEDLVLDISSEE
jgi:hypothetical protein